MCMLTLQVPVFKKMYSLKSSMCRVTLKDLQPFAAIVLWETGPCKRHCQFETACIAKNTFLLLVMLKLFKINMFCKIHLIFYNGICLLFALLLV